MLIDNKYKNDDFIEDMVPKCTHQIYEFIEKNLIKERSTNVDRCSSATNCTRQRQYQLKGEPSEPLVPRKILNFIHGDLVELILVYFIRMGCVGQDKHYSEVITGEKIGGLWIQGHEFEQYKQLEWSFKVGEHTITGHPDAIGKRHDGTWELIEIKSSSNYGFKEFKERGPGDYLRQAHALMMCDQAKEKNIKKVRFFYDRKETGLLWDSLWPYDELTAEQVATDFKQVHYEGQLPAPYDLKFNKKLKKNIAGFPCSYCGYLKPCKGDFKLDFKKDQLGNYKPVFVFD